MRFAPLFAVGLSSGGTPSGLPSGFIRHLAALLALLILALVLRGGPALAHAVAALPAAAHAAHAAHVRLDGECALAAVVEGAANDAERACDIQCDLALAAALPVDAPPLASPGRALRSPLAPRLPLGEARPPDLPPPNR